MLWILIHALSLFVKPFIFSYNSSCIYDKNLSNANTTVLSLLWKEIFVNVIVHKKIKIVCCVAIFASFCFR